MSVAPSHSSAAADRDAGAAVLELRAVSKRFPGVLALDEVSFSLRPGEAHVLFGENGAGKSTLISIIAGVCPPTGGELFFKGEAVRLQSVHHARTLGISAVFQEFSLVEQLTVAQNLFLGAEQTAYGLLDRRALRAEAERILAQLGFPLKPAWQVARLSRAERQMVEIAKAFRSELSVLILDEPTASLTERETERLFELIRQVKARGIGVIYITHRMAEIRRIADRITVLRDGKYIATAPAAKISEAELLRLMTGRVIEQIFPRIKSDPGQEMLRVERLSTPDGQVRDATIYARRGEIVGMAGLIGAGKSKLLRACFGLEPVRSGAVILNGENVTGYSPRRMLDRGFCYTPPDRRGEGLMMIRNCRENISLPALSLPRFQRRGFLRRAAERKATLLLAARLKLYPLKIERAVDHFSGGNQQKVMLARCLTRAVKLYVFDEPTVGVDVGARVEIYRFIARLCEAGAAVVLISSDLPEVLHLSHRLYVMHRGRIQAEFTGQDISQENVLRNFFAEEAA